MLRTLVPVIACAAVACKLAYFSIALNVAGLDWSFGLPRPATLLATSLAVACAYLIIRERRAYVRLFERTGS
jgi:hypothetical protein